MGFDLTEGKNLIQSVVRSSKSIRPGMNTLLEYCARVCENDVWKEISNLNFEKDSVNIQNWLGKTLTRHPPSHDIQAFWFGLNKPVLNNGETSCCLYVSGSTRFNADDQAAGWACLDDESYLPAGGDNAKSSVLHELHRLVNLYEVAEFGEYVLCLGYASLAVKSAFSLIDMKYRYGLYGPRPVAVGFDDGDFLFIEI